MDVLGDVSDESAVAKMADSVMTKYGRIDVLVNNAGISSITPAEEITAAEWRRVMDINLLGPFLCCRTFGRIMLRQRSGSIINVASVAGLLGVADRAAYNASKHGLIGLTRTLAAEWGGRGVRCNAVCPGWVRHRWTIPRRMPASTPTATSQGASRWLASLLLMTSRRQSLSLVILGKVAL